MVQRSAVLTAVTACSQVTHGQSRQSVNSREIVTFEHRQLSEAPLRGSLHTPPSGNRLSSMAGVSFHPCQASRLDSVARKSQAPRPSLGGRGFFGSQHRLRQETRGGFRKSVGTTKHLRVLKTRSHSATSPDGPAGGAAEAAGSEASQEPGAAGGAAPGTGSPVEGANPKKAAETPTTGAPPRSTAGASPAKRPSSADSPNNGVWAFFSRFLPDVRAFGFVLLHLAALVVASKVLGMDSMFRSMVQQLPSVRFVNSNSAVATNPTSSGSASGIRDATSASATAAAGARVGTVTGRRGRKGRTGLGSKPITVIKDETGRRPCHVASNLVVPFSEFLHHVKKDNVQALSVDGDKVTFVVRRVDGGAIQPQHRAASLLPEVLDLQEVIRSDERLLRELDIRGRLQPGGGLFGAQQGKGAAKQAQPKGPFQLQLQLITVKPPDLQLPYSELAAKNVEFGAPEKVPYKFVNNISFALLYAGILASIISRLSVSVRGPNRVGGKQKKGKGGRGPGVLFADVAGVDEAKEELEEIVEYLRKPERFTRLGARPPRGVLLVGPPGTGKTMLAKAVAGEADVPFVSCSGSEFVELYVGLGASRVRELFAQAKKEAPSIVFIDEIDSVAKVRDGRARSVGNDEREQTLNQLLTEMDGFDSNTAVIVLAATNRADVIDPALRRPGRFDRIVAVEPPDRKGRVAILNVHIEKQQLPLADNVDVARIASATTGFTGADLANIVNEAALLAAREESCNAVARIHFDKAVERAIAGIEKKRSALGASEKVVVARHEVGHAILGAAVAKILTGHSVVQKISIIPRSGGALGFAYIPPPPDGEERQLMFVDELRGQLAVLLGGRAAEEVAFNGRVSTGAMDDIRRATDIAYKGLAEYGLSSSMGPLSISTLSGAGGDGGGFFGFPDQGRLAEQVQQEVQSLLQEALSVAREVVRRNTLVLHGLGTQLEEDEAVEGEVLKGWLDQVDCTEELQQFLQRAALLPLERTTLALPSPADDQSEGEQGQ